MPGRERAKRERKRRARRPPAPAAQAPEPAAAPRKSKDDIARERLVPLEEGERPRAVTIAAILAALIAVANVIGALVGGSEAAGALPFAVLMGVAAFGMWRSRYWAVLGFQVILALTAIFSLLFLLVAGSDPVDILIALAALVLSGTMFWFLVKALARIQMPERRPHP
jgi:hypothetical protein